MSTHPPLIPPNQSISCCPVPAKDSTSNHNHNHSSSQSDSTRMNHPSLPAPSPRSCLQTRLIWPIAVVWTSLAVIPGSISLPVRRVG